MANIRAEARTNRHIHSLEMTRNEVEHLSNGTDLCLVKRGTCVEHCLRSTPTFHEPNTLCYQTKSNDKLYQCVSQQTCHVQICWWHTKTASKYYVGIVHPNIFVAGLSQNMLLAVSHGSYDLPLVEGRFLDKEDFDHILLTGPSESKGPSVPVALIVSMVLVTAVLSAAIGFVVYRYPAQVRGVVDRIRFPYRQPKATRLA
ncbi:unnamed protein product [Echinostoma caproni]|uniref:Apple domain-containing protein n=1 Tax=Echinostoma caproni TaxID=27848 RepID=A0A183AN77_9TREM|nr:unnamed protein product [Echinostoma caproni]